MEEHVAYCYTGRYVRNRRLSFKVDVMPPRLSKRQQREQDELEALAGASGIKGNSDQSDDESLTDSGPTDITKGAVGFAAVSHETQ